MEIHSFGGVLDSYGHAVAILGKLIEFVDEIDKEKFFGELSRNVRSAFESVDAPSKIKSAATLMVVNNAFVVKLGGPQSKQVVKIWRSHEKTIGLEKA